MRHHRIPSSKRHKKLKSVGSITEHRVVQEKVLSQIRDQPMPKKLAEIMEFKSKNNISIAKAKRQSAKQFPTKLNSLTVPSPALIMKKEMTSQSVLPKKIEQGMMESDYNFLNRINRMVSKEMAQAKLEDHFGLDSKVKQNDEEQLALQSKKDKEQEEKKKAKRKMKDLKRKEKKTKKKYRQNKLLQSQEFSFRKDQISFGELVHQPPSICLRIKKNNNNNKSSKT